MCGLGGPQDREIKRSDCFLSVIPWYYGLLVQITAATLSSALLVDFVRTPFFCWSNSSLCHIWHKIKQIFLLIGLGEKKELTQCTVKNPTLAISSSHRVLKASSFCCISSSNTPPSISVCANSRIWFLLSPGCRNRDSRLCGYTHRIQDIF